MYHDTHQKSLNNLERWAFQGIHSCQKTCNPASLQSHWNYLEIAHLPYSTIISLPPVFTLIVCLALSHDLDPDLRLQPRVETAQKKPKEDHDALKRLLWSHNLVASDRSATAGLVQPRPKPWTLFLKPIWFVSAMQPHGLVTMSHVDDFLVRHKMHVPWGLHQP